MTGPMDLRLADVSWGGQLMGVWPAFGGFCQVVMWRRNAAARQGKSVWGVEHQRAQHYLDRSFVGGLLSNGV